MLDGRAHERVDQCFQDDLTRDGLRYLDHGREVEVFHWCRNRARRSGRWFFLPEVWIHLVELPHLAVGSPTQIAVASVLQIHAGNLLETTRRVEAGGHLMGQALVLHKSILACRPDRLLVQPHGIKIPVFDASELGRYQRVLVAESRWIIFGPLAQLVQVRRQEFAPPVLIVSSSVLVERCHRQRGIVKVIE